MKDYHSRREYLFPAAPGGDRRARLKILIVDDDPKFRTYVGEGLRAQGIESATADSAETALERLRDESQPPPDLMLVDVMMPGRSGWELLEELRAEGRDVPVIFVTAKREVQDRVRGLRTGADDYILKPFEFDELLARIDAVARRRGNPPVLAVGDLKLDPARRLAERAGRRVELSPREYDVLRVLVENRGRVVSRGELLRAVWGIEFDPQTNLVDTTVARLRRRIDRGRAPSIETVVGQGYRILNVGARP